MGFLKSIKVASFGSFLNFFNVMDSTTQSVQKYRHVRANTSMFTFSIMLKVLRGVKVLRQNSLQKNTTLITFDRVIVLT